MYGSNRIELEEADDKVSITFIVLRTGTNDEPNKSKMLMNFRIPLNERFFEQLSDC
jgi:hypothetical protein